MILPQHKLGEIDFYTATVITSERGRRADEVKIYWKVQKVTKSALGFEYTRTIAKPPTTIVFPRWEDAQPGGYIMYTKSDDARNCLRS